MKTLPVVILPLALLGVWAGESMYAQALPNTDFRVKLLGPLSTQTSRKGDKITAQVLSPEEFSGAILEGKVTEVKGSGKIKGESVLNFTFETLNVGNEVIPVESQVKSVTNSKGQPNVDEEGRMVRKTNNLGKAAAATGLGALIGGIAGGGKGAAIGAGVGAAASLVMIQVAVKGNSVAFDAGSEFIMSLKERRKGAHHDDRQ
jgi:hypothetical protein